MILELPFQLAGASRVGWAWPPYSQVWAQASLVSRPCIPIGTEQEDVRTPAPTNCFAFLSEDQVSLQPGQASLACGETVAVSEELREAFRPGSPHSQVRHQTPPIAMDVKM